MKNYAIIVAGGSGSRMKTDIPKQFLLINGRPILMHTVSAFHQSSIQPQIILVVSESYFSHWEKLCKQYSFNIPHKIVSAGSERFNSVQNALSEINEESLIAVHDAVRPVVTNSLIENCFEVANKTGTAIPVVSSRDSLREKKGDYTVAIDRNNILIVQTPQVFKSSILLEAYKQPYSKVFTDDASVVENNGNVITTVEGDSKNIKITYLEDLEIASLFLDK